MTKFNKLYEYSEGIPENVKAYNMPVFKDLMINVNTLCINDPRPKGEKPTQKCLLVQYFELGLKKVKELNLPLGRFKSKSQEFTQRVVWLTDEQLAVLEDLSEKANSGDFPKEGKYKVTRKDVWLKALEAIH